MRYDSDVPDADHKLTDRDGCDEGREEMMRKCRDDEEENEEKAEDYDAKMQE